MKACVNSLWEIGCDMLGGIWDNSIFESPIFGLAHSQNSPLPRPTRAARQMKSRRKRVRESRAELVKQIANIGWNSRNRGDVIEKFAAENLSRMVMIVGVLDFLGDVVTQQERIEKAAKAAGKKS